MSLEEYARKRDFRKTSEPKGKPPRKLPGKANLKPRFVVQKHAASRLHYDFRLEMKGVLRSWAVPKGPSLHTSERRLAVMTEDHPLEYGDFEGIIPEGEYGGGTVQLWDRGEWQAEGDPEEGLLKGRLKFTLEGERLKGGWALARMGGKSSDGGKNWLLIKHKDDAARPSGSKDITEDDDGSVTTGRTIEQIGQDKKNIWHSNRKKHEAKETPKPSRRSKTKPLDLKPFLDSKLAKSASIPASFRPQLATLVKAVPEGENWIHEVKFDGYRIIAIVKKGRVSLLSRNGKDWTRKFPSIVDALVGLEVEDVILDGEIVALDKDGRSDFQSLQNNLKSGKQERMRYYVFDMPYCRDKDLRQLPLEDRKVALRRVMEASSFPDSRVMFCQHVEGNGGKAFAEACKRRLEGIISKSSEDTYRQSRSRGWVKIKCSRRQELIIGGFTDPGGSRDGFGALLVGYHGESRKGKGNDLVFAGRVGTGFDDRLLRDLRSRFDQIERKTSPFANPPTGRELKGVHWVKPDLVCEVEFTEWTTDGSLRHPSFQGLREDKPANQVVRDVPVDSVDNSPKRKQDRLELAGVSISSPEKVLFSDQSLTKRQLAEFYQSIADWVLPHVIERPLSLLRCPDGAGKQCFFQKHIRERIPEGIYTVPIREKSGKADYLYIKDITGLVALVQMGVLEVHPWGCRVDRIENPDYLTFDLDPEESVGWEQVCEGALLLRDILHGMELESFVKLSGNKGLHIVVPIQRTSSWDQAKEFTKSIANSMESELPEAYVATMSKNKRKGRIFIDYLRNGRGATSVAAYSTRAKTRAAVSAPISWGELIGSKGADAYTIENLPPKLRHQKDDPWEGYFSIRQSITKKARKMVGMEA